jgi:hypothetical protein
MKRAVGTLLAAALLGWGGAVAAQEHAYTEGQVVQVTSVKVKDGQFENYMKFLDGPYKATMEGAKKAGLVTDYGVYGAQPHNPNEADLYLVVFYPNMAVFDGMQAKMDAITSKATGMSVAQSEEAAGKRSETMRTILGEEQLRELKLH